MKRALVLVAMLASACSDDVHVGGTVAGTAKLYNGATPAGVSLVAPQRQGVAADGKWLVSPNRLTMKLTTIGLMGNDGGPRETVDCSVTYDQSQPGLTELGDCPFSIPPGTYTSLNLSFSTTISILVDDPTTGLFSTASGLEKSPPPGGAQEYSYMISGFMGGEAGLSPLQLPAPLTVADGDSVQLSVVINALQSLHFTVSGGTVSPGWTGTSYPDPGRPDIVATAGSLAKIKLYASSALNTAASYCAGGCTNLPPMGITSVTTYYTSPTTIAMAGMQLNGPPASCLTPGSGSFVNDPRSYTGLDSNGVAGWAGATDANWTTYSVLYAMPQVATIGESATLYCSPTSGDPAPPGGSFASGAPAIQTAGNSLGAYVLVAQ
jgi:hypothetical protein